MSFWAGLLGLLNKLAPFLIPLLAYLKGKSAARQEVDTENMKKELEYAKIDAAKPDGIDDDLDRMRTSTF